MKHDVVYKPKSPLAKMSDEHAIHLDNLANGGLMRTVTPDDVADKFLQMGYARKAAGGLMATEAGQYALMMHKRNDR